MSNQTLAVISSDMRAVLDLLQEEGGELNTILESWFDDISKNLTEKVDAYHGRLEQLERLSDIARKRAQDAQAAARTIERMDSALRDRIKHAMTVMDTKEVRGVEWRYRVTPTKGSLVFQEERVPDRFKMQVTTTVVDKERLRAALEAGEIVSGAVIEPGFALRSYRNAT